MTNTDTFMLFLWTGILVFILLNEAGAATFTVTNTNDSGDSSLRWAITQANSNSGSDTILFDIPPASCGGGICTISPTSISTLPAITDDGTIIDGYSQSGASVAGCTSPAVLKIEIDGSLAGSNNGLTITSANNLIRGLIINRFALNGIAIGTNAATGNVIEGNHIGTNFDGTVDLGNGADGIFLTLGAHDNLIGYSCSSPPCLEIEGCFKSERNVISGNGWAGVEIHSDGTENNRVNQNFIGTSSSGNLQLGNTLHGVRIYGGAKNNTVSDRNVISGNSQDGVRIAGVGTTGNVIAGNYIGTNRSGLFDVGNGYFGVNILDGAQENTVAQNIISGNDDCGVSLCGMGTNSNTVAGNIIGTNSASMDLGNTYDGVYICEGAQNNMIGGDEVSWRNIISANDRSGIYLTDADTVGNIISGNFIGTDVTGFSALGNQYSGISVNGDCQDTVIGGSSAGKKNVISGNGTHGISIRGPAAAYNTVLGNYIGTNADGTAIIANSANGIDLGNNTHDNMIGPGNIIAGSGENGIEISGNDANNNTVSGNFIGTDSSATLDLGNTLSGVYIWNGDILDNTVGPANTIAHNGDGGVVVDRDRSLGHRITRNSIFANTGAGIDLREGANNGILPPAISSNSPNPYLVTGTACPDCTVEIFANDNTDGEGEVYLGSAAADGSGNFTVRVSFLPYPYLTATATDSANNTSEFSEVFEAEMPFPWTMFIPAITNMNP